MNQLNQSIRNIWILYILGESLNNRPLLFMIALDRVMGQINIEAPPGIHWWIRWQYLSYGTHHITENSRSKSAKRKYCGSTPQIRHTTVFSIREWNSSVTLAVLSNGMVEWSQYFMTISLPQEYIFRTNLFDF